MCEAISITLGILSAGLGIAQSVVGYQQAQENVAAANAQAEQNFRFQQMQANSARAFEQLKAQQQAAIMEQYRYLADQAYESDIGQLNLRLVQEQEAASEQARRAALEAQKGKGEILSMGRLGPSIDNLIADYYRQQAVFDYATERNLAFAETQTQMEKRGAAARRGSRIASQQPYLEQPIIDPLEPIYQPAPSALPYVLGGVAAGIGGIQTGISAYGQVSKIKAAQPPKIGPVAKAAGITPRAGYYGPAY